MKKLIYLLSLTIAIVFASCSSSKDELAEYISDDAMYVAKINTENLITKSGCKLDGKEIIISEAVAKLAKADKSVFVNPLDATKNIYVFGTKENLSIGLIKISNVDILKDPTLFDLSDFEDIDGFTTAKIDRHTYLFIKDNVGIILNKDYRTSKDELLSSAKAIFDKKGKNDNKELIAKVNGDEDIIFHVDFDKASKVQPNLLQVKAFAKSVTASFDFGKNDISYKITADTDENNPMIKQISGLLSKCDTKTLKYFPESTNLILGLGIDGKALKESGLANLLMLAQPELAEVVPVEEIIELINGSVIFGVEATPDMFSSKIVATIESKEPQKLLEYIVSIDRSMFTPTGSNYYLTMMPNVILSAEDNYLLISNIGKDLDKSLADNKNLNNSFRGSLMCGYTNSDFLRTVERSFRKINTDFDVFFDVKSFKEAEIILSTEKCDKENILEYIFENAENL